MEERDVARSVASGVAVWSATLLLVRRAFPERSFDFCSRIVSAVHAAAAVVLACLSVADWRCPVCPVASTSSPAQMRTLAITLSYLMYDLVCCMFNTAVSTDSYVHHFVSITGIAAGLAYKKCGSEMVASLAITEISSPFLHLREILKELGIRDTSLNLVVDILFALIFSLARMVGGPYLCYLTVTADNPILIKAMAVGLQLVSAFWFYKIIRMMNYKLKKWITPKKQQANGISRQLVGD